MSLRDQIEIDIKTSMKNGDGARRDTLRMVKSKILEAEVSCRAQKGQDYRLSTPEVHQVINSYVKKLRQAAEVYESGGRSDLSSKELSEIEILNPYLPKQLSEERLRELIGQVLAETGASSTKETGLVMKTVMGRLKGQADGRLVSQIVQELLS
jgi:uncharacterized protein YqeY